MNEFLKVEYQSCMDLVKYYDQRQVSMLQFSSGLSSAVCTALLALYKNTQIVTPGFWSLVAVVTIVTLLGLIGFLAVMVQNRLYFVFPARQLNAIRKYALSNADDGKFLDQNRMYLDADFPAFKMASGQTSMLAMVSLQIGVFVGISWFAVGTAATVEMSVAALRHGVIAGGFAATGFFVASALYLESKSKFRADCCVHLTAKDAS